MTANVVNSEPPSFASRRIATYMAVGTGLVLCYGASRNLNWTGSANLHTIMEVVATLLAMTVGVMALVRFYSKRNNTFLFIGAGFLGTAFLDGYHAIVTSVAFQPYMPSDLPALIPWSWIASRQFLSIFLFLSWLAWLKESRSEDGGSISEKTVYLQTGAFTLISFAFFAFAPLPPAYYPELFFSRPEELLPAIFFAAALAGYLHKGDWRHDIFEHWLVLSLIVGFIAQVVFMSFSGMLFDLEFDIAHLLKKASYTCVLTGLMGSMYAVFRIDADRIDELENARRMAENAHKQLVEQAAADELISIVSVAANESTDAQTTLEFCLTQICEFTGWEVGHVFAETGEEEDEGLYRPTMAWHLSDPERFDAFKSMSMEIALDVTSGTPGRAFTNGRPYWMPDFRNNPKFERGQVAVQAGLVGAVGFPVMVHGKPVAILAFFSTRRLVPDDALAELINQICPQIARVLEREQNEKALKAHRDHLQERVDEATADLTHKTRELEDALANEKEVNEQQRQFVSTVSHEFRTPLAVIDSSVQRMLRSKEEPTRERIESRTKKIRAAVDNMVSLINSTLSTARMEAANSSSASTTLIYAI